MNLARTTASRAEIEPALALFRETGDRAGEGRALDAMTMAAFLAGDLDTAIACAAEALPHLAAAGDRPTEASCLSTLGFVLLYRGRRAEGEARLPGLALPGPARHRRPGAGGLSSSASAPRSSSRTATGAARSTRPAPGSPSRASSSTGSGPWRR